MKPIPVYFPMTYLSPVVGSTLAACFGQTAVYRPSDRKLPPAMQAGKDAGRLLVRLPAAGESDRLAQLLEDYYAWARENRGVDLSLFKGRASSHPFFGSTSISRIRQEIRDGGDAAPKEATADPVFEARLFLEMAQALDRRNDELEQSLDDVRGKETRMLAELMGDDADPEAIEAIFSTGGSPDPGAYMTGTRLQAWWRLARSGPLPGNLLVTNSRAVIEHLVEIRPGLEKIDVSWRLPYPQPGDGESTAWQARVLEYLVRLTEKTDAGPAPVDVPAVKPGAAAVNLSLYRYANAGAADFFNRLAVPGAPLPAGGSGESLLICRVAEEAPNP